MSMEWVRVHDGPSPDLRKEFDEAQPFLCRLGIHRWQETNALTAVGIFPVRRYCRRSHCGSVEELVMSQEARKN